MALSASIAKHSYILSGDLEKQFTSFAPITKQYCRLREGLKNDLTSSTFTLNQCHHFGDGIKTELVSTNSTSFETDSNILNVISSSVKPLEIGYFL